MVQVIFTCIKSRCIFRWILFAVKILSVCTFFLLITFLTNKSTPSKSESLFSLPNHTRNENLSFLTSTLQNEVPMSERPTSSLDNETSDESFVSTVPKLPAVIFVNANQTRTVEGQNVTNSKGSSADHRSDWCKTSVRHTAHTKASIIITVHNDDFTTLLEMIVSIFKYSPPSLIEEVILVDDFSDEEQYDLKTQPLWYFKPFPKVRVIRTSKILRSIQAEVLGLENAKSPIVIFMKTNILLTTGWLEPLIDRIEKNATIIAVPIIHKGNSSSLNYLRRGAFDWNLKFTYGVSINESMPFPSPVMSGDIFAISKKLFKALGRWDPLFEGSHGSNIELSFKAWMCGASIEFIPCSRVIQTEESIAISDSFHVRNLVRTAKVWMDEYAEFYFQKIGGHLDDFGDVTKQQLFRQNLVCHSFEWYLTNVYPDLFNPKFNTFAGGEISNMYQDGRYCLDLTFQDKRSIVSVKQCHSFGGSQAFWLTKNNEIRQDDYCLEFDGREITANLCLENKSVQKFQYNPNNGSIQHSNTRTCMQLNLNDKYTNLTMSQCENKNNQRWRLKNVKTNL